MCHVIVRINVAGEAEELYVQHMDAQHRLSPRQSIHDPWGMGYINDTLTDFTEKILAFLKI